MKPDHSQRFSGQGALVPHHEVQILIVAPAHDEILHAALRGINPVAGGIDLVSVVRVRREGLGAVDDGRTVGAPDGEGITHHVPLALAAVEEEHQLAEVVDQSGQLHPAGFPIAADGLGGLEQVLDLAELRVRVGVVD